MSPIASIRWVGWPWVQLAQAAIFLFISAMAIRFGLHPFDVGKVSYWHRGVVDLLRSVIVGGVAPIPLLGAILFGYWTWKIVVRLIYPNGAEVWPDRFNLFDKPLGRYVFWPEVIKVSAELRERRSGFWTTKIHVINVSLCDGRAVTLWGVTRDKAKQDAFLAAANERIRAAR